MAAVAKKPARDDTKLYMYACVGKDKTGKVIKGETRAAGDAAVAANLRRQGIHRVPPYGWGTVTVPGAIDAFVEVQRRHGKLTFAEVLEPAIYYASEGFPVSEVIAQQWQAAEPLLSQFPSSAQTYLVDGQAPRAGDVHRQPNLARTLQLLASEGKDAFYRGDIARRLVQCAQATGGFLELDDLVWDVTMGRGADTWTVVGTALVQFADQQDAQRELRAFLSADGGAGRLKAALEAEKTLSGLVSYVQLTQARRVGKISYAGVEYLGCELVFEVMS